MSAFLQIITRVYRRPKMLMANIKSLEAQSDPDWEQTMIVDGEGRGVGDAQAALANFSPYVSGQYIWILDDDDLCVRPNLVMEVKKQQLEEASKSLEALQQNRKGPVYRLQHYLKLIGEDLAHLLPLQ